MINNHKMMNDPICPSPHAERTNGVINHLTSINQTLIIITIINKTLRTPLHLDQAGLVDEVALVQEDAVREGHLYCYIYIYIYIHICIYIYTCIDT